MTQWYKMNSYIMFMFSTYCVRQPSSTPFCSEKYVTSLLRFTTILQTVIYRFNVYVNKKLGL